MGTVTKAVIPAAGTGTRLLPATKSQPKEMLPVGRKPVIQYVVEELVAADAHQVLVITSQQKRAIEDHFDVDTALVERLAQDRKPALNHVALPVQMFYTRQSVPRGLADAIGLSEHFVAGDPFLVSLGDSIIRSPNPGDVLKRLVNVHRRENASATILFEEVRREDVVHYGIARPKNGVGAEFEVADLIEKPSVEEAPSRLAVAARYVFDPLIFEYIRKTPPGRGGEIQITDSMRLMLRDGHRIFGVRLAEDESRLDIGNYRSYYEAFLEMALDDPDPQVRDAFAEYARRRLETS
jgi:UTP--glucose-1-phosphate uridylyltransferase